MKSPVAYEAPKEPHVWDAIIRGSGAERATDRTPLDTSRPAIIGGLQFNMPNLYREIRRTSTPYAFIDRAPISGGRGSGVYRVIPNAYHANWVEDRPDDRLKMFGGLCAPWRRGGKHVLVCPSSDICAGFWDRPRWLAETLETLKHHTDRPIKIRHKNGGGDPADVLNAHAVVTFVSMIGVDAARLGIPVFSDPASCAAPIAQTDLSLIEAPIRPDRSRWLATLAYWQFTVDEMRSGYCWNRIKERL